MNAKQIAQEVKRMMNEIRESPAYSFTVPSEVTREYLEQLKVEIDMELDGLASSKK